jgi:hypothetical protein
LATLNPARHIQPALERLSVFILDIATITPRNEYFQTRRLTRKFVAREVVSFAKLVIYAQLRVRHFDSSSVRRPQPRWVADVTRASGALWLDPFRGGAVDVEAKVD